MQTFKISILFYLFWISKTINAQCNDCWFYNTKIKFNSQYISGIEYTNNAFVYGIAIKMNIENSRTKIGLIRTGGLEIMEETICSVKNINNAIFFDSTIHFNWFVGDSGIIYNYNQKVKIKQDTVIFIYTLKANDTFVIKDKFFSVFEFHLKRITIPLFHLVGKYCCISDSIEITRNEIVIKNNRFYGIKLIDTVLIFHDVIISGYYFSIEKINYLLYKDNNNKLVLFVVEPNLSMIYRKE